MLCIAAEQGRSCLSEARAGGDDMSIRSTGPRKRLRRGLWSPDEDAKLRKHVSMYGYPVWSYVPKAAGLERSGKSCRLRWLNYLRPGLKRGAFSLQEEDLIVGLHSILGNRWSQIAARMPGRTDNEIKNFWHSFVRKRLRLRGIDPVTYKPVTADTATRPTAVFSEAELTLPPVGQHHRLLRAPQAISSTDASVVVRSDVSMVLSWYNQTGDFTCALQCIPSGIVHPAIIPVVSSSSTVCPTTGLSSTGTVGTIQQCRDKQLWLEPGWMGSCTAAANNSGARAALDELNLNWSDYMFYAD